MNRKIVIATRGSKLAKIQAEIVADKLNKAGMETEFLYVSTAGDKDQKSPLTKIGGNGLFVRGVEDAILSGEADIAVHSAKDLPYTLMDGLLIGGLPDQADPRDCLIYRESIYREHPVIGTSSPRRELEARKLHPQAEIRSLRGNVPSRVEKLRQGEYDGIILACAGIQRLGLDLSGLQQRAFETDEMIPAPCQGIIAVECREDDRQIIEILESITDSKAKVRFQVERYLFAQMQADCSAAIAVYCQVEDDGITIRAGFGDRQSVRTCSIDQYREVCDQICQEIYQKDEIHQKDEACREGGI